MRQLIDCVSISEALFLGCSNAHPFIFCSGKHSNKAKWCIIYRRNTRKTSHGQIKHQSQNSNDVDTYASFSLLLCLFSCSLSLWFLFALYWLVMKILNGIFDPDAFSHSLKRTHLINERVGIENLQLPCCVQLAFRLCLEFLWEFFRRC